MQITSKAEYGKDWLTVHHVSRRCPTFLDLADSCLGQSDPGVQCKTSCYWWRQV